MSMPPVGWWPLTFLVAPLLGAALVLAEPGGWRAFALGTLTGTVAFLGILTWAVNITPGGPLAWPTLSLIEGLYVGVFAALVAPLLRRRWLALPALGFGWLGLEVVRGSFPEHGFGWAEFAYAHVQGSWLLPLARIGGGRLITLFVALLGAALFESWRQGRDATTGLTGSRWDHLQALLPHAQRPLFVFAGLLFASVLLTIEPPATAGTIDVLVVQGNDLEVPQTSGRELDLLIARRHLELTTEAVERDGPPELVVWPESSVDRDPYLPENADLLDIVRQGASLSKGALVVGITREGDRPDTFRNTTSAISPEGIAQETYDKRELVPFGEYVPARRVLGRIGPLRSVARDAIPGTRPVHLRVPTSVGPVELAIAICFETLFGRTVRENVLGQPGDQLAGVLIATTNDASFGRGSEPAQHLAQSQLRAVETGRWVVHAAISGSSAIVDPQGQVHSQTELFDATTIRARVPVASGSTPYLRIGDVADQLGLAALALLAILRAHEAARRRRTRPPETKAPVR